MDQDTLSYHMDRAATYNLLARLMNREVDPGLLAGLSSAGFPEDTGSPLADEANRLMGGFLAESTEDPLTDLAVDFARLFIVRDMGETLAAYPYESVYTSVERTMMADARDGVAAFYRSAGLNKSPSWKLGEDHIALELEFMGVLCQRTVEAARKGDGQAIEDNLALQESFLKDHLLKWAPKFCDGMFATAKTDFYRGVALLLKAHLKSEAQAFVGE